MIREEGEVEDEKQERTGRDSKLKKKKKKSYI